jgi:spore germination cell wall hydrolase CwlJ-like protein
MKNVLILSFLLPLASLAQTYQHRVVAAVILGEAACQGSNGMLAVGEVISQRAKLSGATPLQVVCKRKAFSCLNGRSPDQLVRKQSKQAGYPEALRVARLVVDAPQRLPGIAKGATHFTRADERPSWARGVRPVLVLKDHAFYKLPY